MGSPAARVMGSLLLTSMIVSPLTVYDGERSKPSDTKHLTRT